MADRLGIEPTLTAIAFLPLLASLCAFPLPGGVPREAASHVDAEIRPSWNCRTMRPTYPASVSYSLGPGPLTPAGTGADHPERAGYLLPLVVPALSLWLGLVPALVVERWWLWQPVSYMFLHGGLFHLLFNMLALWMFGVDLERQWGTRFFARYYFVSGVGAAVTTLVMSLLPSGSRGSLCLGDGGGIRRDLRSAGRLCDDIPAPAIYL